MEQIMKQLEYLDKTELLKRFVSLEFNRFLDYYKDAEDLNYHEKGRLGERSERGERGMRDDRGERGDRGDRGGDRGGKRGDKIRFKMNIGNKDGINPARLLGIINEVVGDKTISVGDIEVTNKFTFFDIFNDQSDKIINAFAGQTDIELGVARESKGFSDRGGSGDRRPQAGKWRSESTGQRKAEGGERRYGDRDRKPVGSDRRTGGNDRRSEGGDRRPESGERRSESSERRPASGERRTDYKRSSGKSGDKPWRNR